MSKPIRVLHCMVNMNRGGAETLVMNIYRNIDRTKVQFDFLTSASGVFDDEIKSLGGRIYRISYITKSGPFKYSKSLFRFFSEHKEYKIVHSHMDRMSGLIMREAKRAGVPVRIAHSHSTRSEGGIVTKIIKRYYSTYLDNATNFFACSESAARFMFGDKKAKIIKNGIDYKKFVFNKKTRERIRKELGIEDAFVVGHVGRFFEPKNHIFLIKIFAEVHKNNPASVLVLVGSGSLEQNIRDEVTKMGLKDSVLFLGSRGDVNELLNAFDVFVFPSLFEGLGIVAIEAQASGLKCMLSDRVPKEVDITGNIEFVPLEKSLKEWAEIILNNINYERHDMTREINEAGYDITETAHCLERFYLDEWNKIT